MDSEERILPKRPRGFTLIEVLVVISIIGFLAALAYVNVSSAREKARINAAQQFESTAHRALSLELIGHWKLDSRTPAAGDADVPNEAGSGYHGISGAGTVLITSNCIWDNCFQFDGTASANINLTADDFGIGTSDFSISAWIKTPQNNTVRFIFRDRSGAPGFGIYLSTTGQLYVEIQDASNFTIGPVSSGRQDNDRWHHILISCKRNSACTAYIDGVRSTTVLNISSVSGSIANVALQYISNPASAFVGSLDNVRLYRAALNT